MSSRSQRPRNRRTPPRWHSEPTAALVPFNEVDLPVGLRDYVSDEALTLAASSGMAPARAAWDQPQDFVDQIDYQLAFRSRYDFLTTDPDHLASLLLEKPRNTTGSEEMSLFLTRTEAAELQRRDRVGEQIDDVELALGQRGTWSRSGRTR